VIVVGIYTFVGTSGVFSFGHMAFATIGAYTAGIVTIPAETKQAVLDQLLPFLQTVQAPAPLAPLIGGLVAAAFAALVGLPIMRLTGIAASLATFALLVIIHVVVGNWTQVTNGAFGLGAVPITVGVGSAIVWAVIAIVVAYAFQQSRFGLRLRSSREDEVAAQAIGVSIGLERRIAWIISAFFCGVGGALFGSYIGAFNADTHYLAITFLTLAMLVVGGVKSLSGAVVGSLLVSAVGELLRRIEGGVDVGLFSIPPRPGVKEVGLALVMLSILLLRPAGLTGGREVRWPFPSRHASPQSRPERTAPLETTT
jgi:branched-chain amino acid transport system permease protein